MLFKRDQSLLQSKPTKQLSNNIPEVLLLLVAEPHSITVSSLLDGVQIPQVRNSSSLRTNGVQTGELLVSSRLVPLLPTYVVSSHTHPSLPLHEYENISLSNYVLVFIASSTY